MKGSSFHLSSSFRFTAAVQKRELVADCSVYRLACSQSLLLLLLLFFLLQLLFIIKPVLEENQEIIRDRSEKNNSLDLGCFFFYKGKSKT